MPTGLERSGGARKPSQAGLTPVKLTRHCSYRYQLEFFVDKVKGRQPRLWMDGEDSTANMKWIEKIYEKVSFVLTDCASKKSSQ